MSNGGAWADIGWSALARDDVALAEDIFTRALDYPSFVRLVMRPRNLLGLAEIALRRGDFDTAQARLDEAHTTTEETGMRPHVPHVTLTSGRLNAARGAHELALACFADAEAQAAEFQLRPTILAARRAAAESLAALGRHDQAEQKRAQAQALDDELARINT
jgi:tetratricopeptide (TPR) repeat protein